MKTISCDHLTRVKDHKKLAKGAFGKCKIKMYQGQLVVTKEFRKEVSKEAVMKEAGILSHLSHPGVPFVLGIDLSRNPFMMVTVFYGIDMSNTTLFELLNSDKFNAEFKLDQSKSIAITIKLAETLSYIHDNGILHNDIKSDNIVFYGENTQLKPVLIDFGKACAMKEGKFYKLSKDQQLKYKKTSQSNCP